MKSAENNRFQDFFEEDKYIVLKSYIYNYILRKRAVAENLETNEDSMILEVGSGLSPVTPPADNVIYSDLSLTALQTLKNSQKEGMYVVADATALPFKESVFTHVVCSEVLEHIPDDKKAVKEVSKVLEPSGDYIITFPHRKFYFAADDRFVEHFRRYELDEMESILHDSGFETKKIVKVLGPLEKILMNFIVFCFLLVHKISPGLKKSRLESVFLNMLPVLFKWINRFFLRVMAIDTKIMPRSLASLLLIKSKLSKKSAKK
ncbi:class I SAM-dependent methyltransferase [Thermodesulfobacteriota bacterium]